MGTRSQKYFDIFRLIIALVPCIFFLPELTGRSVFAGWDVSRLNLPLKFYDVQSVREGALPLWNQYLYAGMPQLAESESGLFYPGNFLLHLPGDFFYLAGLTYILHFILAGLFMDLWLRSRGIKPAVSLFGSILFQTAPFLLFHITSMALLQSIIWFPLILWLADRYLDTPFGSRKRRLVAGWLFLMGGMLLTIGSAQMAFYQGFLLFLYLVGKILAERIHVKENVLNLIGIIASIGLGAILLGAIIIFPALDFAQITERSHAGKGFYYLGSNWLNPLRLASIFTFPAYAKQTDVVGWASSLIYISVLPTLMAALRLAGIRVNWKTDAPLIIMGCVAMILAFGMFNPINHILIKFPPFSMFRYQGRMALGVIITMIPLACHHLSSIETGKIPSLNLRVLLMSGGILALMGVIFYATTRNGLPIVISLVVLIIDFLVTILAMWSMNKSTTSIGIRPWLACYIILHLVIVYPVGRLATLKTENFHKALDFFDKIERDDGQPSRLLVAGAGEFSDLDLLEFNQWSPQDFLPNLCAGNTGTFRNVQTMNAYTPLRPVAWDALVPGEILDGFDKAQESGSLDTATSDLLQVLGVDAVVTSGNVTSINGFEPIETDLSYEFGQNKRLFRTETEQPRLWMVSDADIASMTVSPSDAQDELSFTLDYLNYSIADRSPVSSTALIIQSGEWKVLGSRHNGTGGLDLKESELRPNYIRYVLNTSSPGWLIAEHSVSPGWKILVDKLPPSEVLTANAVFQAVRIDQPGDHLIEFQYAPKSVIKGINISGTSLIILLIWMIFNLPRKPE